MDRAGPAPQELEYLHDFPGVNADAVGTYVGSGAQHIVRTYGEHDVVKYPRSKTWRDLFSIIVSPGLTPSVPQIERDVRLCRQAFGPITVAPHIEVNESGDAYALIQPHLSITDLEPKHLDELKIREELQRMIEENRRLILDERLWFDFMGWNGEKFLTDYPHLDNVSLRTEPAAEDPKLAVLDCTLFPVPHLSLRGIHAWIIQQIQKRNLRRYGLKF